MRIEDLAVFNVAMEIGDDVWQNVLHWQSFEKSSLGKQMVRAADSISLNIAEANGRFYFKERMQFYYYSRGSLFETKSCLTKAYQRGLILQEEFGSITRKLNRANVMLNSVIRSLKNNLNNQ